MHEHFNLCDSHALKPGCFEDMHKVRLGLFAKRVIATGFRVDNTIEVLKGSGLQRVEVMVRRRESKGGRV